VTHGLRGPCTHCGEILECAVPTDPPGNPYFIPVSQSDEKPEEKTAAEEESVAPVPAESAPLIADPVVSSDPVATTEEPARPEDTAATRRRNAELEAVRESEAFRQPLPLDIEKESPPPMKKPKEDDPKPTAAPAGLASPEDPSTHSRPHCGEPIDLSIAKAPHRDEQATKIRPRPRTSRVSLDVGRPSVDLPSHPQRTRPQSPSTPRGPEEGRASFEPQGAPSSRSLPGDGFQAEGVKPRRMRSTAEQALAAEDASDVEEAAPEPRDISGGNVSLLWLIVSALLLCAVIALASLVFFYRPVLDKWMGRTPKGTPPVIESAELP